MKRFGTFLTAAAVAFGIASNATAQSVYGCSDLDGFHSLPSVEGTDGIFFRVEPELRNFHAFSDETVEDVARLSQVLSQFGTTLVYLPIPPKAMILTDQLPQRAYDYGFDPNLAATVYDDMVLRLRDAGVVVADARRALSSGNRAMGAPYFKADYRLNALGARLTSDAVAQALVQGAQAGVARIGRGVTPTPSGTVEIKSDMRNKLQRHCLIDLPKVMTDTFSTAQVQNADLRQAPRAFGMTQPTPAAAGGAASAGLALVGTAYSALPEINFAGFLQAATGLPVTQVSLDKGGAFDAFLAYVSSDAFQESRPSVIVWETPVYNNLAQFGDQPIRELIAAAGDTCRVPLPVMAALDGASATVDLAALDPSVSYTLYVDSGGVAASEAQLTFVSRNGGTRTKTVLRDVPETRTGQFFVPLTGLWPEGVQSVDITLDTPFGEAPRVAACFY